MIADNDNYTIAEVHEFVDSAGRRLAELRPLDGSASEFKGTAYLDGYHPDGSRAKLPFQFVIRATDVADAYAQFNTAAESGGREVASKLNAPKIITPPARGRMKGL